MGDHDVIEEQDGWVVCRWDRHTLARELSGPGAALTAPDLANPAERTDMPNRTCSVADCDLPLSARGLCAPHYREAKRRGVLALYPRERSAGAEVSLGRPVAATSCSVEGCVSAGPYTKALCKRHYMQAKYRDKVPTVTNVVSLCPRVCGCERLGMDQWCGAFRSWLMERAREWSVLTEPPADPLALPVEGPCWTWTRSTTGRTEDVRYGLWSIGARNLRSHRVTVAASGRRLGDLHIDHRCRNTLCVNPDHLDLVTNAENKRRTRVQVCQRGHAMTPENVYLRPDNGYRQCKACGRLRREGGG